MFGLLGDCGTSKTFFIPTDEQIAFLVAFDAVAVKHMTWTSGSRLDTSPKLANSRRNESPLHEFYTIMIYNACRKYNNNHDTYMGHQLYMHLPFLDEVGFVDNKSNHILLVY